MAVNEEAFKAAEATFRANPTLATAAMFFSKAREAEENGELDDDEWLNACADIEGFLWSASASG